MLPTLFKLGPFTLHSWGLLLLIAFWSGLVRGRKVAPKYGIDPNHLADASIAGLFGGVLGGRLGFVLQNFSTYKNHLLDIGAVWQGGMTSFGGLIGGVLVGIIVARRYKLNALDAMDCAAPSLAIGYFFGRIGCLLNGCCYGTVCELPWAMRFTDEHGERLLRHPTQLYSVIAAAIIFAILIRMEPPRRAFRGQLILAFTGLYGLYRFIVEFWRAQADSEHPFLGLSTGQWASIALVAVTLIVWPLVKKKHPLPTSDSTDH